MDVGNFSDHDHHNWRHYSPHTGVGQNSLLHREALLVVSARDPKHVSSPLLSKDASVDLLGHAALVEVLELGLIVDLEDLLEASSGVGNVHLHGEAALGVVRELCGREG